MIGLSSVERRERRSRGLQIPPDVPAKALVDTGCAGWGAIRGSLAAHLRLKPRGFRQIYSPISNSPFRCPDYKIALKFTHGGPTFDDITVGDAALDNQFADDRRTKIDLLIGRQLLVFEKLEYDGANSKCMLTFP